MDENLVSPEISFYKLNKKYQPFNECKDELWSERESSRLTDSLTKLLDEMVKKKQKIHVETLQLDLSRVSHEIINAPRSETKLSSYAKELKQYERSYKNAMEKFQYQLEKFLRAVKELRQVLKKTVVEFHNVSKMTAQVTLLSSGAEIALVLAHCVNKLFDFSWNPNVSKLTAVVGAVSVTASLFALSYMKHSTAEISRHVRNENRMFLDLILLLRKGSWIDEEVVHLFPHGINSKLITDLDLEKRNMFKDKMAWKEFLCSVILLTNIQKDENLLKDWKFREKVRLFVESKTAEIWWHRKRLRKLLDDLLKKIDDVSSKEFVADHEVHYRRTSLYLYTILIPWLMNSWNSTGMRIACSAFAAILAVNDLESNDGVEFDELQRLSKKFEKDFQGIAEIYEALENDYE